VKPACQSKVRDGSASEKTMGIVREFIEDPEYLESTLRKWGSIVAGGLFSGGWWCWADAVVRQKGVEGHPDPPGKYLWPTVLSCISLVLINMLSRDQLRDIVSSGDDESTTRARLWLLFSFVVAFASVGGSISILVAASGSGVYEAVGWGSVASTGLILLSSLMLWRYRSE